MLNYDKAGRNNGALIRTYTTNLFPQMRLINYSSIIGSLLKLLCVNL